MQPPVTTISATPGMSNPDRGTGERGDREHAGEPDLGHQQAQQQRHERGPGHSSGTPPSRLAPGSAGRGASWPGAAHRSGLRHVLGAARDAELGFWPARQHPAPTQPRLAPIKSAQNAAPVLLRNPACIEAHQEYQSPR